ncbi:polyisoprenoid diphosphate/phosphate phosphohydrolase PLPP6 [Hetaerina americana]|uniref:polyisoprenoid diphosphate/phosphate phosphohydrolase PLPP6 n=1 Tax=Hetaerina americana TaxID=62018 RepID=UPI003A7F3F1F
MENRQRAPPLLGRILDVDEALTEKFCRYSNHIPPLRWLKKYAKSLEVSCHGLPWFTGVILMIVISSSPVMHEHQVNLLFGLFVDVILVAIIKAYVRRRRPLKNRGDMFATFSIDNFSFPSGHASRAVMVAYFFTMLCPLPSFCVFPLLMWAISVCLSRILLNRHYLLDVIGGVTLGYLEGIILSILWLSEGLSCYLISWMSSTMYDEG